MKGKDFYLLLIRVRIISLLDKYNEISVLWDKTILSIGRKFR